MKRRQTSIELLRITAMLMVLILHTNFLALGTPTSESLVESPVMECLRILLQSATIAAVDIFVMISGWFGIKASVKGFAKFMWQVVFIIGLSYTVEYLLCDTHLSLKDFFRCFGLFGGGGWFVATYIGLYIFSPVLNVFINNSSIRQHGLITLVFIAFEVIFGDTLSVEFIVMGYSTFSFIGLYLLAAFLRRIKDKFTLHISLIVSMTCIAMNAIIYTVADLYGFISIRDLVFNYINPLVIIEAASILLVFDRITPPQHISQYINTLSASCFAVYLLHAGTSKAAGLYCGIVRQLACCFENCYISGLMIVGFIVLVFINAIIFDQPRKLIWNKYIGPKFK